MGQPRPVLADDPPEPPQLRRLRLLVSLLMVVLIAGMIIVAGAMVIRLGMVGDDAALAPVSAERIPLPAGAEVLAVGRGEGGVMIVTRDAAGAETLRIFDPATGSEKSATPIIRE